MVEFKRFLKEKKEHSHLEEHFAVPEISEHVRRIREEGAEKHFDALKERLAKIPDLDREDFEEALKDFFEVDNLDQVPGKFPVPAPEPEKKAVDRFSLEEFEKQLSVPGKITVETQLSGVPFWGPLSYSFYDP